MQRPDRKLNHPFTALALALAIQWPSGALVAQASPDHHVDHFPLSSS